MFNCSSFSISHCLLEFALKRLDRTVGSSSGIHLGRQVRSLGMSRKSIDYLDNTSSFDHLWFDCYTPGSFGPVYRVSPEDERSSLETLCS